MPNNVRAISVLPAPIRPATPTISPSFTSNETSCAIVSEHKCCTLKIVFPTGTVILGYFSRIVRPTIFVMIVSISKSAKEPVVISLPSRIIVMSSVIYFNSSSRCEIYAIAHPSFFS